MKILLVKLSSLGDVVHTLPVVQDIRVAMPDAQIDWVLEKSFASLLVPLLENGALRRIIPCDIRRWRKSPFSAATWREWRAFKTQLQSEAYDAVIDLQGLTKSALVAWLARLAPGGKRYAMANQTEGSGYEAPTRWAADVAIRMEPHIHAVQRSRELAAQALGYKLLPAADFGLKEAQVPDKRSMSAIKNIAFDIPANTVVLVHGTSRADKEWPLDHWVALGQRLAAAGHSIALVHGNAKEAATSKAIARGLGDAPTLWPVLQIDGLAAALARSAGVVGVDSGVSHIAVALGLPHVQIYNFDTAWRTGPPEAGTFLQRSVFAQPAPSVDAVWQAWRACGQQPS
ncbi:MULTISPECIES: lipopolysaccharide heptosyltransferase I [Polaromonas]|uniref:Lipopolysaccharide heptosyltransferase 1 n=1 Tax=Polaromonas aquatica TaxID=332657 RepID=A0ABW1TVV2_9BURK